MRKALIIEMNLNTGKQDICCKLGNGQKYYEKTTFYVFKINFQVTFRKAD